MLTIHVLNAGKGDSIVLHYKDGESESFGVIDSNSKAGDVPALRKLDELGARRLSFLMLTHPHADHYLGLEKVLSRYAGNIDTIFTFPVERDRGRLEKLAKRYLQAGATGGASVRSVASSFVEFLAGAARDASEWEAPTGLLGMLPVEGFADVSFRQILPPSRVKGRFYQDLDKGTYDPESAYPNELCLAVQVHYAGVSTVLGADGTQANWLYQQSRLKGGNDLGAQVVKLPHHGSAEDCSDAVLDTLFAHHSGQRIALISANGTSHPSAEVLQYLRKNGIAPFCTNLSRHCAGAAVRRLAPLNGLDPALRRFVGSVLTDEAKGIGAPCQGDLALIISSDGKVQVERQYENFCPYRDALV